MQARRGRLGAVMTATLLALALVFATVSPADARTDTKSKPVILVHGYNFTGGTNCSSNWSTVIASLKAQGFTGPFIRVSFYGADTNCDVNLHSYGSFADRDSWKAIAKALSNYVYTTYTSKGIAVDLVGHSMGGLITRGAVYGAGKGESGFSKPIDVEDSVTLATPHDGAAWYSYLCLWGQCSTLKPGSSDLNWLNQNGNPQGAKGTDWTVTGSSADDVVPLASAMRMTLPAAQKVAFADVEHSDELTNSTVMARLGTALTYGGQ